MKDLYTYYRVCEGFDDESFRFVDLKHTINYSEDQFDDMYVYAKNKVRFNMINKFATADDVAQVMCDTFGFTKINIKIVRNIDTDDICAKEPTESMTGVFDEIGRLMKSIKEEE
jgi:hypothetical protein